MSVPPPPTPPPVSPADLRAASRMGNRFSLATLFVLVTASAVLIAGIAPLLRDAMRMEFDFGEAAALAGGGWLFGLILGVSSGLQHYHIGRATAIGAATGSALGLLLAPLAMLRSDQLLPVGSAMFVGSLLIVGVAFVMRSRG